MVSKQTSSALPISGLAYLFLGLIFAGFLLVYLNGNFPNVAYNPPDIEAYNRVVNKSGPFWDAYLIYWANYKVALALFLAAFFSFLLSVGSYKKSIGNKWNLLKRDIATNLLGYGMIGIGILLFIYFWPSDPFGTTKWSWTTIIPLSIVGFIFLLSEPTTSNSTKSMTSEQLLRQKSSYKGAKIAWLILTAIPFFIGLVLIISSSSPTDTEEAAIGSVIGVMFGFLAIFISIFPFFIFLYFLIKSRQLGRQSNQ